MRTEAYLYAIRLLSKRDYSRHKLTQKLKEKGYEPEKIEAAIEEVIERKYLREDEYTRIRVRQLIERGHSDSKIFYQCQYEKIEPSQELIDSLRSEYDRGTDDMIDYLISKKMRSAKLGSYEEKMKTKQRISRFLLSKGHSFDSFSNKLHKEIFQERSE